ncbi:MAG: DUF4335 domain-containing protein [Phormidesmis sp.]
MTIRRQYQLPNCSLVLDGLSIDPTPGNEEVMSLLVNAECRISGLSRSLNGGYNFFAALVRAVSQYGQEVLSGYAHPQVTEGEPLLVHINPGDGPYHHLVVQPEIADLGDAGDGRAIDIKLSSVQLFDLTEAVDQFFDDMQTLPELEPALSPLARRFVRSEAPLSDRALPAALGIGGLVAATMALGLISIPKMRDPALDARRPEESAEVAKFNNASDGSSAARKDAPAGAEDAASDPPSESNETLDDASVVAASESVTEAEEGVFESPTEVDTPNSEPFSETVAAAEPTTFENSPPAATRSFSEVEMLNQQLKQTIVENREQPRFGEPLTYRVRVDDDGKILGYQPEDSKARSSIDETPLPALVEDAPAENSAVDYRVVFTERGVVEVSPWWGWNFYN